MRVAPSGVGFGRRVEGARRGPIETLRRVGPFLRLRTVSVREEAEENLGQGLRWKTLEGRKPKGASDCRTVAERRLGGNGMLERVKTRKSRIA
jgi:hypothetical protein